MLLSHGLRDYSITAETPLLKYKAARGIDRWLHGGAYGRDTYITCNWRSALYFGPVLFRMEFQPGTRMSPATQAAATANTTLLRLSSPLPAPPETPEPRSPAPGWMPPTHISHSTELGLAPNLPHPEIQLSLKPCQSKHKPSFATLCDLCAFAVKIPHRIAHALPKHAHHQVHKN